MSDKAQPDNEHQVNQCDHRFKMDEYQCREHKRFHWSTCDMCGTRRKIIYKGDQSTTVII